MILREFLQPENDYHPCARRLQALPPDHAPAYTRAARRWLIALDIAPLDPGMTLKKRAVSCLWIEPNGRFQQENHKIQVLRTESTERLRASRETRHAWRRKAG
jgi:hypothetical protein